MDREKRESVKAALTEGLPLAAAIATYGVSFGMMAVQAKFSPAGTAAMSALVYSGSVQMVAVAMLNSGAGPAGILLTALLLNLRNLLYGAALAENLAPAKRGWRWFLAFGVSDEQFVLASARMKKHGPDPLYFGVVVVLFYAVWILSSLFGALAGDRIDPMKFGLDLAFPVTFAAILFPSLKGKPALATAGAAAVIAGVLKTLAPGNGFTIIAAGVLAPLAGLLCSGGSRDE